MLGWIFNYKAPAAIKPARNATPAAKPDAAAAAPRAPKPPPAPAAPTIDWAAKLQAALGDDATLLALAREATSPLQTKLAAVAALVSEESLKQAERDFRSHDRRVHSLAKQRAQAQRAQRETRAQAVRLIDAARALAAEAQIPVNSAVELDRAWAALDATLLEAEQRETFAALAAQLSALTRQRAEREATLKRWNSDSRRALDRLQAACTEAASGTQPHSLLGETVTAAQAVAAAAPEGAGSPALSQALVTALALDERLALLDLVLQGPSATTPVLIEPALIEAAPSEQVLIEPALIEAAPGEPALIEPAPAEPALMEPDPVGPPEAQAGLAPQAVQAPPAPVRPAQQWKQLPPLADTRLAALLQGRFEAWQRAQDDARQHKQAQRRELVQEHKRAVRTERGGELEATLVQAEARLADGLVAETHKHLIEIDELLYAGAPAEALRARIGRLQDGYAELRGWQHWAGGRARDELTQEAEALAAGCAPGPEGQAPKLQLKPHADLMDDMRARWKELDRLGGASSRALWQRFDAALKTAYEPLAAHKAAQGAVREQNLAARRLLLEALEGVALIPADEADGPADLRPAIAALDQFRIEWRKLGPLEHTVPHKARDKLVERMNAALQRLQAPLDEAWQRAQREREALIERAQALAAGAQANAGTRDLVGEVRALQGEWQQRAKALPLPRNAEGALWTQFRSALDAVFSAREAAFNARDAEFKAYAAERAALIERLESLGEATPAETKRTLAEVDTLWQRAGPAPRAQAAALDERFHRAREAARQWLAGSRQRAWQAGCDALAAKLALCEALERSTETDGAAPTLADDWAALPALPEAWEAALRQRAGLPAGGTGVGPGVGPGGAPVGAAATQHGALSHDELLLQLEAAWNLPSPPVFAAARRELQLRAMKAALETRRASPAAQTATAPEQWLAEALRRPTGEPAQRERLNAVLAALRQRGPSN